MYIYIYIYIYIYKRKRELRHVLTAVRKLINIWRESMICQKPDIKWHKTSEFLKKTWLSNLLKTAALATLRAEDLVRKKVAKS